MNRTLAALLFLAVFSPAALPAAPPPDPVLARVGDEPVTASQLEREFTDRHAGHARFLGGESEVREFLDKVIDRRLLLQEAYRLGLDRVPAVATAADAWAENKAVEWLLDREITARARPSEAAIRAAWEERTTTLYRVSQIVVATREEAERLAAELRAGADFGELAREHSTARSRFAHGALGEVGWGTMSPEWEAVVFALAPGETSAPFASPEGWQLVRLEARRSVEKPDFAMARGRIAKILETRARADRRQQYGAELWKRYRVQAAPEAALEPAALTRLQASAPATVLYRWQGGELDLGTFATGLDLAALAAQPAPAARAELERLLRLTVNDALVRLEVRARRVVAEPSLAPELRHHREGLMESVLYADHVLKGVTIPEARIRAWYDEHRDELKSPERRRTSQILVGSLEEAAALRQRWVTGEAFAELAKAASRDPVSAAQGGDLGWITAAETPPEFAAVLSLPAGAVTMPIRSQLGWHLIQVTEIEPAAAESFAQAHDRIRERLFEEEKRARRAEWVRRLREVTPVTIDQRAIERFVASLERSGAAPPAHPVAPVHP